METSFPPCRKTASERQKPRVSGEHRARAAQASGYVQVQFVGKTSIYPGSFIEALEERGAYDSRGSDCEYTVFPASPEIATLIRIKSADIQRLYAACWEVVQNLVAKSGREIPVSIKKTTMIN